MNRRGAVLALAALGAVPLSSLAQQARKIWRVGLLSPGFSLSNLDPRNLFQQRMHELGYVEGKNLVMERRFADNKLERLPGLAIELVRLKVDVIVAAAIAATSAARKATSTIPIVMLHAGDPIGAGLVASLARPGGNVTGTTSMIPELGAKQVQLIRELVPRIAKLGVLVNPTNAGTAQWLANVTDAARSFNIRLVTAKVTRAEDFQQAHTMLRDARSDGLLVLGDPLIFGNRARIMEFAASARLPASYDLGQIVRDGGLLSYGTVFAEHYAMGADYVDKILRGAKPVDLPVEQPRKFEMVINLKTAKALGITIPQSLLVRADEVIQ